jgi:hypothetical protein
MRALTLIAALLCAAACTEDETEDPCGQPVYGGDATDEAWHAIVDAESRAVVDANAPELTVPSEAQVFSAAAAARVAGPGSSGCSGARRTRTCRR